MQIFKYHLIIVFSVLSGLNTYPQNTQKILVLGENGPLSSAHLLCGNDVIAVSDSSGRFYFNRTNAQNQLRITHVQYEEIAFDAPATDTLIYMQKSNNLIQGSVFREENQWNALKTKLKKGLSLYHSMKGLTITSRDTLIRDDSETIFNATGTILFYLPTKKPITQVKTIQDSEGEDYEFSNIKEKQTWTDWLENSIKETFGNAMYYAYLLFLPQNKEGLFITYKGYSKEYDVFEFYLPPAVNNGKARVKGTIYIQSDSGILAQIEARFVPLKPNVSTLYDINIQYTYNEQTNAVLPTKLSGEAYYLDEELNITMTRKSMRAIDSIR